jgi:hypothetical protein
VGVGDLHLSAECGLFVLYSMNHFSAKFGESAHGGRAHAGVALSGVFLLYRVDNRFHTYSTKNRPFWTLAEVLANYRGS